MNQEILKKLNDLKRIGGITKEEILQGLEVIFPREFVVNCNCGAIPRVEALTDLRCEPRRTIYQIVCCQEKSCGKRSAFFNVEEKAIEDWNKSIKNLAEANIKRFKELLEEREKLTSSINSQISTRRGIQRRDKIINLVDEQYPIPQLEVGLYENQFPEGSEE